MWRLTTLSNVRPPCLQACTNKQTLDGCSIYIGEYICPQTTIMGLCAECDEMHPVRYTLVINEILCFPGFYNGIQCGKPWMVGH